MIDQVEQGRLALLMNTSESFNQNSEGNFRIQKDGNKENPKYIKFDIFTDKMVGLENIGYDEKDILENVEDEDYETDSEILEYGKKNCF